MKKKFKCIEIPPENKCEYCHKVFSSQNYLELHKCKLKDDQIRILEMKLKINVNIEPKKCRYCFKTFARTNAANVHMKTCKRKETYLDSLEKLLNGTEQDESSPNIVNNGYVYLIKLKECVQSNENVFKLETRYNDSGNLTINFNDCIKDSEILLTCAVSNLFYMERKILSELKNNFKCRLDFGHEYFEGNLDEIRLLISRVLYCPSYKNDCSSPP